MNFRSSWPVYNLSPLLPHREKVFALLFPHPVYMPHLISKWPTRLWSHSLYPGYKSGLRTPVHFGSPLSWPAVPTVSPTLVNFISLSFCLMSGNSFQPAPRPRHSVLCQEPMPSVYAMPEPSNSNDISFYFMAHPMACWITHRVCVCILQRVTIN